MTAAAGRPVVVAIGGSDPIGAAGIQADIRHLTALGVHAAAVPTALTIQRLDSVDQVVPVDRLQLRDSLEAVSDTFEPNAVVIGMLANEEIAREVLLWLHKYHGPVVLDPVLASSSGTRLLEEGAMEVLQDFLVPRADLTLPNVHELAALTGAGVPRDEAARLELVESLLERGTPAVLSKGGHAAGGGDVVDILHDGSRIDRFVAPRIGGRFRGTGGALACACAAYLAAGRDLHSAAAAAHGVVQAALARAAAAGTAFVHLGSAAPMS